MKKMFPLCSILICLTILLLSCSSQMTGEMDMDLDMGKNMGVLRASGLENNYEYDEVIENGFIDPATTPNSTFSLDRNTSSYAFARRILTQGGTVPTDSVRIEEYINYFSYNYPAPNDGEGLNTIATISDCPWNSENKLFTIGIKAEDITFEEKKPNNFVFLLDISGSMYGDDRLGLIQQAFTMLTDQLADNDRVSIVTYASGTYVRLEGAMGFEKTKISNIIQDLEAGGSTNGEGGIQRAYELAQSFFIEGGNNRVILATDGDFNVGISSQPLLKEFIKEKASNGVYLSVLGVGMGNTQDTTMKTLAENGNGNYAYLDSLTEARKVLVEEMGGTLVTVAKDAKIQVSFSPELVAVYRLIGYETKMMTEEEFEDENKDAGEIGAGHTVTAVYEIKLKEGAQGNFANVELRYKDPSSDENKSKELACDTDMTHDLTEDVAFIGCVTEFGLILRDSAYKGSANFENLIARLEALPSVNGEDADEFRAEFLTLVKKSAENYSKAET